MTLSASVRSGPGMWASVPLAGPIGAGESGTGAVWIANPGPTLTCKWWRSDLGDPPHSMLGGDFTVHSGSSHAVAIPFGSDQGQQDVLLVRNEVGITKVGVVFGLITSSVDLGIVDVPVGAVGS